jgi:parallel beta-helix repeat protein
VLTDVSAVYSINNVGSTVSSNIVSSLTTGFYVIRSSHVLLSSNTVTNWSGDAIAVIDNSSDNEILSNEIIDAWHGIYLNTGAARNTVRLNTIIRAVRIGIIDTFSGGGNVITGNTINQTPVGIWTYLPAGDTINPNTFYNTKRLNVDNVQEP